jgi:hypothetical protein
LDRLREELGRRDCLPILFDFEKPKSRDTVSTVRTLAGIFKFVIADLTEAKSVLEESEAIVPEYPSVPVRFIILESEQEAGMLDHITQYRSVVTGAFVI